MQPTSDSIILNDISKRFEQLDVKNNIYYVDLNGEKLRTTSMDLQKINY